MSEHNSGSKYVAYLSLGAEIAAGLTLPILLGYWLDGYFNSTPWLVLTGCMVGMVNIFILIFQLSKRLDDEQ